MALSPLAHISPACSGGSAPPSPPAHTLPAHSSRAMSSSACSGGSTPAPPPPLAHTLPAHSSRAMSSSARGCFRNRSQSLHRCARASKGIGNGKSITKRISLPRSKGEVKYARPCALVSSVCLIAPMGTTVLISCPNALPPPCPAP